MHLETRATDFREIPCLPFQSSQDIWSPSTRRRRSREFENGGFTMETHQLRRSKLIAPKSPAILDLNSRKALSTGKSKVIVFSIFFSSLVRALPETRARGFRQIPCLLFQSKNSFGRDHLFRKKYK